jgi:hypothetical protein
MNVFSPSSTRFCPCAMTATLVHTLGTPELNLRTPNDGQTRYTGNLLLFGSHERCDLRCASSLRNSRFLSLLGSVIVYGPTLCFYDSCSRTRIENYFQRLRGTQYIRRIRIPPPRHSPLTANREMVHWRPFQVKQQRRQRYNVPISAQSDGTSPFTTLQEQAMLMREHDVL